MQNQKWWVSKVKQDKRDMDQDPKKWDSRKGVVREMYGNGYGYTETGASMEISHLHCIAAKN